MHARNYTALDEAGVLAIEYDGENLDMNAIAVIQINLQAIAELVVENMADGRMVLDERKVYTPGIVGEFRYSLNPAIRLVPSEIRIGSLFEYVIPFFPALADPDVRAAMQGVLGNIVFAIGSAKFGRYFRTVMKGRPQVVAPQIDVGANVAAIAVALAQHGPEGLKIKYTAPDGSVAEVEISTLPGSGVGTA